MPIRATNGPLSGPSPRPRYMPGECARRASRSVTPTQLRRPARLNRGGAICVHRLTCGFRLLAPGAESMTDPRYPGPGQPYGGQSPYGGGPYNAPDPYGAPDPY